MDPTSADNGICSGCPICFLKECIHELLGVLAENLIRLRKKQGLSQEKLAERADIHRTFISLIERRGRNVTLGVIEALATALSVNVTTLVTEHHKSRTLRDSYTRNLMNLKPR